jgi:peptidoglycan/LPS O-acetylase OafA/YrhL
MRKVRASDASENGAVDSPRPFAAAGAQGRVASLDVLRGFMALFVAVYHHAVWTQAFAFDALVNGIVTVLGVYSVEGFFIISGFCFFHVYRDTEFSARQMRGFHLKRFARIAPVYYLAVALNLALDQRVGPFFSWLKLFENVTLSFGLVHPNHAMVLGGWSIGIEYVFYLAFPLLAARLRSAVVLYASTLFLTALAWPFIFDKVSSQPEAERFHAYVQIPNHAFLFLWGGCLADLYRRSSRRLRNGALALGLLALVALLIWSEPIEPDHFSVMVGLPRLSYLLGCLALVALFAFAAPISSVGSGDAPQTRALAFARGRAIALGDLSYAVYLLHPFAWLLTRALLTPYVSPEVACIMSLILTLLLATIVHHTIERPAMRLGKRLAYRHARERGLGGGSITPLGH